MKRGKCFQLIISSLFGTTIGWFLGEISHLTGGTLGVKAVCNTMVGITLAIITGMFIGAYVTEKGMFGKVLTDKEYEEVTE